MNIDIAYKECCELIDKFEKNYKQVMSSTYNEAQLRRGYLDDFFEKVLGWDVSQRNEKNLKLAEVLVENPQKQKRESGTKKVDYAFHTVTNKKQKLSFFVEAKKPSVQIKSEDEYLQIKKYAKTAHLPISILTDFEQFHIIDCRAKISKTNVLTGDNKEFYYTDFRDKKKFEFLYNLFSRDAVYNGSIEKYVNTLKPVKGYQTSKDPLDIIGDEFLNYIEELRTFIAKALKKNDNDLDGEQLTEATQKIIDRLVFTRFLEDKGIEDTNWIKKWAESKNAFETFIKDCDSLDRIYNGAVYHKYTLIDKPKYIQSDSWFVEVCNEMIDPYSDYQFNFNYIPIEILGSVYERFLGSVIRATAKDAKPEQKPEVRKAGGVYYTPKYIVDYIVENTVGKLIQGKKPKEISKLKFADIACGSGSFLIGVYDCLLKYHNSYYNQNTKQAESDECIKLENNSYRLSIRQKRDILINNVFGVDIDAQAVEVAQLSLYLKMLEEETQETLRLKGNTLFTNERVLPDLKNNIVCGNSLIGTDIKKADELFDFEDYKHLNPMDYDVKFPSIMKNGGFDAIVGNPPYVTLLLGKKQKSEDDFVVSYYQKKYPNSTNYKLNLYAIFIERCQSILRENGLFSYIIPNSINLSYQFEPIRKFIINKFIVKAIIDLRYKVFKDAEIGGNTIFFFSKGLENPNYSLLTINSESEFIHPKVDNIKVSEIKKSNGCPLILEDGYSKILNKISKGKIVPFGNIVKMYQGIITGDNKKFIATEKIDDKWKPILKGRDISRYNLEFANNYVYYVPDVLWSNTDINMFNLPKKIISRQTSDKLIATIDTKQFFSLDSTHIISLLINTISIEFVLGVYNSTFFNYLYQNRVNESGRVFAQVKTVNVKPLPFPQIDHKDKQQKQVHDKIVSLVNQMLQLKPKIALAKTEKEKDFLEHQCQSIDNQIDELVYKLYDLTPDEIEIVKSS